MKVKSIAIFVLAFVIFLATEVLAETTLWQAWIIISDAPSTTIAWDPNPAEEGITFYEVKDQALYPTQEWVQTVTTTTATFVKKRTGFHRYFVRACRAVDDCSEWTASDGPNGTILRMDGSTFAQPWGQFLRPSPPIIK